VDGALVGAAGSLLRLKEPKFAGVEASMLTL